MNSFLFLHISKTGLCDDAICDWPKGLIVIVNKNKNKNNRKNKNSDNILFCIDTLFQVTDLKFIVTIDYEDDNKKIIIKIIIMLIIMINS